MTAELWNHPNCRCCNEPISAELMREFTAREYIARCNRERWRARLIRVCIWQLVAALAAANIIVRIIQ